MSLINSVISWMNVKRIHQIDLYGKYPHDIQKEVLFKLLKSASDTEWGKKFGYQDIGSIKEYQEKVPLQQYENLKPWVDRLREGEKNLLWPGKTRWFAKSSGTTSDKSKFIPVTNESLEECHFRGGKDVIALYVRNNPETNLAFGKSLTIGGSTQINNFSNNSYYGDLSAILIENVPFWTEFVRIPPTQIALIEEFEEKINKIIDASIEENVVTMAGVPSWYLILLKKVLEKTGKKNITEVWPNLELFIHGGVNFEPYREQFRQVIPSGNMHYMETYNASEGFFAIQDNPQTNDMLLMLDIGIFYEFIPMKEWGNENPRVVSLEDVKLDENYAIVISTNGGLWRYIIGDTVKFTSQFPHKIKITGRTRHFINAFGEELIVENAEQALKTACSRTGAIIEEYTAGPVFIDVEQKQKGAHQWIIEFEKMPVSVEQFAFTFDNALKTLNSDYEAKRHKDITLEAPKIVVAPQGTFYNWMKQRGKVGGQNKIPRLANDRLYLDQLMELINTNHT
ncbi:MAG: GH3 auxin-responsive promoter family protein [Prolixibacteraceae bacterium]|nr:GH3 auxin-responsive promoter family protein [Prolixibacteraceae bacterium]